MAKDATMEILAGLQRENDKIFDFINPRIYNIEDMDPKACMASLKFSGCYVFKCSHTIDPAHPGVILIDGKEAEPPVLHRDAMFGQMLGVCVRKFLHEYDTTYRIRYTGAIDTEGNVLPDFEFDLRTQPRKEPGTEWAEHDGIVLDAARETAVLLKNEHNALPLGAGAVVNPIGAGVSVFRSGCLGAGKINPRYAIRVREGIEKYSSMTINEELYEFYLAEHNVMPPADTIRRAKAKSDTAVIFISRTSSEASDNKPEKGFYYLTDDEKTMIGESCKAFEKTVVVLNVAYPIEMGWMDQYGVDAVLLTGLSGMAGGAALAEILEGRVNPSGKLAVTWARDYYDYITSRNFITDCEFRGPFARACAATVYEEGIYVGYRYFDTFGKVPARPFGYGLSYTQFSQTVTGFELNGTECLVRVKVKNTGNMAGREVAELYAAIPEGKLEQPARRLVAFAKTDLLCPGEEQELVLVVGPDRISSFDEDGGEWIIEPGKVRLMLAVTSGDHMDYRDSGTWEIAKKQVLRKAGGRIPSPFKVRELSRHNPDGTWPTGDLTRVFEQEELPYQKERNETFEAREIPAWEGRMITFPEVKEEPSKVESFVSQFTDEELARLCVGRKTGWGYGEKGYAGMFYNCGILTKYRLPEYYYTDGNNGVNLTIPNIGFPVSSVMCMSWDENLMYAQGKAIAEEAKGFGLQCVLAPALNLQRNPLCGRHSEYFSEDPLLAGRMAGYQALGLRQNGVSDSMKHFFGNNAETLRNSNHSIMSERTARELYIKAFEFAFEIGMPDTVMTGYNAANGLYCSNDKALIKGILRNEMGFDGYVMTDWGGFGNRGPEGLMAAGISWIAPGSEDGTFTEPILEAMNAGTLTRALMQQNALRLIRVLIRHA